MYVNESVNQNLVFILTPARLFNSDLKTTFHPSWQRSPVLTVLYTLHLIWLHSHLSFSLPLSRVACGIAIRHVRPALGSRCGFTWGMFPSLAIPYIRVLSYPNNHSRDSLSITTLCAFGTPSKPFSDSN